jgi:hypothetical protein
MFCIQLSDWLAVVPVWGPRDRVLRVYETEKFGFSWMAWILFISQTEPRRDRYSIALSFPSFTQTMQIDIKKPACREEINIRKAFPPSAPALALILCRAQQF